MSSIFTKIKGISTFRIQILTLKWTIDQETTKNSKCWILEHEIDKQAWNWIFVYKGVKGEEALRAWEDTKHQCDSK